jgi:hypothetical protein
LYAGSTHLHDIRADGLLGKIQTILFLQVPKIEDNGKMEFPKEFILTPYNFFAWMDKMIVHLQGRIIQVKHGHRNKTHIIHIKIQLFESNG